MKYIHGEAVTVRMKWVGHVARKANRGAS